MKTAKCMLLVAGVSCLALAGNVTYTGGGTGELTDGDAWEGGVAPGADDVAVFTNEFSGAFSQSTAWSGVKVTAGTVELSGPALSLGADGIDALAGAGRRSRGIYGSGRKHLRRRAGRGPDIA